MSANLAERITLHPALSEMGIVRFHEISNYSLRQDGADRDVLRVIYKRAKGSMLPHSRKYKFGRSLKTVIADGGTSRMEHIYEISPFLLTAVAELDSLVKQNHHSAVKPDNTDRKVVLLAEINELKQLINRSIPTETMSAVNSKLDSVRKHIEAL